MGPVRPRRPFVDVVLDGSGARWMAAFGQRAGRHTPFPPTEALNRALVSRPSLQSTNSDLREPYPEARGDRTGERRSGRRKPTWPTLKGIPRASRLGPDRRLMPETHDGHAGNTSWAHRRGTVRKDSELSRVIRAHAPSRTPRSTRTKPRPAHQDRRLPDNQGHRTVGLHLRHRRAKVADQRTELAGIHRAS